MIGGIWSARIWWMLLFAVTTPNLNLEIARFCAEQKKPLLIEKPLDH